MSLSRKLATTSVAAGAAAMGLTTAANAALQAFDYRDAPIHARPIGNYSVGEIPHDAAILYMDGTFKRSTIDWGDPEADPPIPASYVYYDQNGDVTTTLDAADKTADSVWFTYQDFQAVGKVGNSFGGSFLSAGPGGGVAANLIDGQLRDGSDLYEVYNGGSTGVESVATQVDSNLNYTSGYAVVGGTGGQNNGWGWGGTNMSRKGFWGTGFVGFSLEETDGTHYGWVQVSTSFRAHSASILGWAYETLPGIPALLEYPAAGIPGDVDDDGDVDADDIDLMGDYIRTGIAPTTANYDLSDDGENGGTDGFVTILDLDYLVRFLVETSAVDGDGNPIFGTQYGDFNLDGEIELGDLTRLGTYYGVGDKWVEGNANRYLDEDIELGDLTILGTYYGASNGGVDAIPEPMTLSLLALGATGVLGRRSNIRRSGRRK